MSKKLIEPSDLLLVLLLAALQSAVCEGAHDE